jgi:hypothetical protein
MKRAAVILTNYLRPANLPKQLSLLFGARDEFDFIVVDNGEQGRNLRNRIKIEDWYVYIDNKTNLGAGYRFLISCGLPYDEVIAIDDDVFLSETQLLLIRQAILKEPSRVHGVWGQGLRRGLDRRELPGFHSPQTRAVSIVSRVYGYTPRVAFKALAIAQQLGFRTWREIGPTDDILLSAASEEAPICHGIDELSTCETSNLEGVATWKSQGFNTARNDLIDRLLDLELLALSD